METDWQTLLEMQAAKVLPLEGTARARESWPDPAMDTRWARILKPDDSMPLDAGRRHASS